MTETVEQNYDWLIIFLVYNNNYYDLENQDTTEYYTMEEQTKYILNQIRHTYHSKRVKTIFVEAEVKNETPPGEGQERTTPQKNPVATLSMLYKKKGTWLSAVDRVWRDEESITVLTKAESLQNVILKLRKRYNAEKHMIVTVGHGSIVGINYYIPELLPRSSREDNQETEKIFEKEKGIRDKDKIQESVVAEMKLKGDRRLLFLANQEIGEVLQSAFKDKKIDVLVMYNCLMQNIFTQFELRETVDWLVAPLSGISIPGFNYGSILNEINIDPSINGEMVSELFINSIRGGNRYTFFKNDIEETWKIAATRINKENQESIQRQFDTLFTEINKISEASLAAGESDDIINCLSETANHLFSYGNHCLPEMDIPDIGILLEYLKVKITTEYSNLSPLLEHIENLQSAVKLQAGKYIFEGKDFYDNGIPHKEDDPSLKAAVVNMAILFPFRKFESDLLGFIYETAEDSSDVEGNKFKVPSFLTGKSYINVINKILALPQ